MELKEFLDTAAGICDTQYHEEGLIQSDNRSWRQSDWQSFSKCDAGRYERVRYVLRASTYVGGMSGGNCWNDNRPSYHSSGNPIEDLTSLDKLLGAINPKITFLEYKNLYNSLVKQDSKTYNEYYGNSSEYSIKEIDLEELYEYLKEHLCIEPS